MAYHGEEVIIAKNNLPLVELVAHKPKAKRKLGLLEGQINIPDNFLDEDDEINAMFYGADSLANRTKKIKNGQLFEKEGIKNKSIVKLLYSVIENDGVTPDTLITFNSQIKDIWTKNSLIRSWQDMLSHKNEDIRKYAEDLVLYAIYTSGMNKNIYSFYQYIPLSYLKDIGMSEFFNKTLSDINNNRMSEDLNKMTVDVLSNLWYREDIVPTINLTDIERSFMSSDSKYAVLTTIKKVGADDQYGLLIGANAKGQPVFSPIIKMLVANDYVLYKYVGFDTKVFKPVYKAISKRGYYEKGVMIEELGMPVSALPGNNLADAIDDSKDHLLYKFKKQVIATKEVTVNMEGLVNVTDIVIAKDKLARKDFMTKTDILLIKDSPHAIKSLEDGSKVAVLTNTISMGEMYSLQPGDIVNIQDGNGNSTKVQYRVTKVDEVNMNVISDESSVEQLKKDHHLTSDELLRLTKDITFDNAIYSVHVEPILEQVNQTPVVATEESKSATFIDKTTNWGDLMEIPVYSDKGVNVMRKPGTHKHFGNPFTTLAGKSNLIYMPDTDHASEAYSIWLRTGSIQKALEPILEEIKELVETYKENDPSVNDPRITKLSNEYDYYVNKAIFLDFSNQHAWIMDQINSGKLNNKRLLYMKTKNSYYSHADALLDFINSRQFETPSRTLAEETSPTSSFVQDIIAKKVGRSEAKYYTHSLPQNLTMEDIDTGESVTIDTNKAREIYKVFNRPTVNTTVEEREFTKSLYLDDYGMTEEMYNYTLKNEKIVDSIVGYYAETGSDLTSIQEMIEDMVDKNIRLTDTRQLSFNFTIPTPSQQISSFSQITNHSGGAIGSDTQWDTIGREYGMLNNKHYYHGQKTPNGNTEITTAQFEEGKQKVLLANRTLNRKPDNYMNLLARNWIQVKNADAIFAIGTIMENRKMVDGGTGWAVQMAIDSGKPVYVFDQNKKAWFSWEGSASDISSVMFEQLAETPTLTKDFAGIGTRKISADGISAIRDVYEKTKQLISTKTPVVEQPVARAIPQADAKLVTTPEKPLKVYTDGSDIKGTGTIGYGAYVEYGGKSYEMSGVADKLEFVKKYGLEGAEATNAVSNPTMELLGAVKILEAFKNTGHHVEIIADYEGVNKWLNNEWAAKKPWIKDLVQEGMGYMEQIKNNGGSVTLSWVKGHSGNKFNDAADRLAKDRSSHDTISNLITEGPVVETAPEVATDVTQLPGQTRVQDPSVEKFKLIPNEFKSRPDYNKVIELANDPSTTLEQFESFLEHLKNC